MKSIGKWVIALLSAALALSLLAGCNTGGYARLLTNLLESQIGENVEIKLDTAFDRALRSAVQKGGNKPDAVYAALVDQLSLTETVPFTVSGLTSAGAGRQALDVIFESGVNPNAAANNAVTRWLGVLRYLPESGRYIVRMSMTDASGGFILAIDVEVDQPGSGGSSSSSDDDDDENGGSAQQKSYTVSTDVLGKTTYTVHFETGLQDIVDDLTEAGEDPSKALVNADIILESDVTLTGKWIPIGKGFSGQRYEGTFDGRGHIISGLDVKEDVYYSGFFGYIGNKGTVKNLILNNPNIPSGTYVGGVAGSNHGPVENCMVIGGTIKGSSFAGSIVGSQAERLDSCGSIGTTVESTGQGSAAGGVVGSAIYNGPKACFCANVKVTGGTNIGGVTGRNDKYAKPKACYWSGTGPTSGNGYDCSEDYSKSNTGCEEVTDGNWSKAVETMNSKGGAWKLGKDGLPTLNIQ